MAYNEALAKRVETILEGDFGLEVKKMFGGLCFTKNGHMVCGILGDTLMARVGPDRYESCLNEPHVARVLPKLKPMRGMVYVDLAGLEERNAVKAWLDRCLSFVEALPPKENKRRRPKK